jgi:hypothetical protein
LSLAAADVVRLADAAACNPAAGAAAIDHSLSENRSAAEVIVTSPGMTSPRSSSNRVAIPPVDISGSLVPLIIFRSERG